MEKNTNDVMSLNILDYIIKFDALIPKDVCEIAIEELKQTEWAHHQMYDDKQGGYFESEEFGDQLDYTYFDDTREQSLVVREIIMDKIDEALTLYQESPTINRLAFSPPNQKFSNPRMNRYNVGERMHIHNDAIIGGIGQIYLSILFALNQDYEGGEFVICHEHVVNNFGIGDILVFPGWMGYPHQVDFVTKGTRYTGISWCYLFDVGMGGDPPAYTRIRGLSPEQRDV